MNDFVLNIDGYEGPIELLLDLAKKQEVDLKHISILELADQYSIYVKNKIKTTGERSIEPKVGRKRLILFNAGSVNL